VQVGVAYLAPDAAPSDVGGQSGERRDGTDVGELVADEAMHADRFTVKQDDEEEAPGLAGDAAAVGGAVSLAGR
jgi:hypothetical protein